jgi:excisionase family DNA binding protein
MLDPEKLLSVTQAAKRVPQSEVALRRLIKLGRLEAVRIGRQVFVHEDALIALAQSAPRQK